MVTVRPKSTTKVQASKPKAATLRPKANARKVTASAKKVTSSNHRFSASAKKVTVGAKKVTAGARRFASSTHKATAPAQRLKVTTNKAAAPARKAKTTARHSWLYELRNDTQVVFYGVAGTREPGTIKRTNSGKGFSQVKVLSLALTRASAMKREIEQIKTFQKTHGGRPPKYNARISLAA